MIRAIKWTKQAKSNLDFYCNQIAKESPSSAKKVKQKILATAKSLSDFPKMYQVEEYYLDGKGDVRRFFLLELSSYLSDKGKRNNYFTSNSYSYKPKRDIAFPHPKLSIEHKSLYR